MQKDAAYALIAAGVAVGGGGIAKAALDEFLDQDKKASHAEEARLMAAPMSRVEKTMTFLAMTITLASVGMKLYDWMKTGTAPSPGAIL